MKCHSCQEEEATRFFENFEDKAEGKAFVFAWCQSCCLQPDSFYNHPEFPQVVRELSDESEFVVYEVMEE